jgi:hypothetical protein
MLVKLNSEFFAKCRAPASFLLVKKFGEIYTNVKVVKIPELLQKKVTVA